MRPYFLGLLGVVGVGLWVISTLSGTLHAQHIQEKKRHIAKLPTAGYTLSLRIPVKEVKKTWKHFLSQIAKPRLSNRHWKVYFGEKPQEVVLYTTVEKQEQKTLLYLGIHTPSSAKKATHYQKEIKGLLETYAVVAMKKHLEKQLIASEKDIQKNSYKQEQLQRKIKKIEAYLKKHPDTEKTLAYQAEIKTLEEDIQRLSRSLEKKRIEKERLVAGLTSLGN